jgi:hypothetical protein
MSRSREEYEIQVALVGHILLRAAPGLVWTATANGELRNPVVGAKLKRMGVKPGVPDLYFAIPGRAPFWLELKTIGGRLSEAQKEFIPAMRAAGVIVHVAHGLDEALAVLESEGAISLVGGMAPNPRNEGAGVGGIKNQLVRLPRSATGQRRPSEVTSKKRPSPRPSTKVDSDTAARIAIASTLGIDPGRVHLNHNGK